LKAVCKMFSWLILLCGLVALGAGRPVEKSPQVSAMARMYALLHPNTEIGETEECTELTVEDESEEDKVSNPLNAVTNPNLLWPGGVAYYTIQNGVYTPDQIARIEEGIADLQRLTRVNGRDCIRILPRSTQADYVSVENYSGCSSYVGRIGRSQRMSLVASCVTRHGVIMHEFLHAFGFHHEQKRYDRDDWCTINWDNIQPGTENNFVMLTPSQITLLGTRYDYGSVMHYGPYAFAIDTNVPTIIPHFPAPDMGQRITLSKLDIERVQILYGCLNAKDSVFFKDVDMSTYFKS